VDSAGVFLMFANWAAGTPPLRGGAVFDCIVRSGLGLF
jgi:hypothetical protein